MSWNWQQSDWPNFRWNPERFTLAEARFLMKGGVLLGSAKHIGDETRIQIAIQAMTFEALATSAIEGETLDRASVQSSLQKQLGLAADKRRATPAEQGIAETMVDIFQTFDASNP